MVRKIFDVIFHSSVACWAAPPIDCNIFGTSGNFTDLIVHAKIHTDRLWGFGLQSTRKPYVPEEKHGRPQHCLGPASL
jgi:hypothetical protein